MEKNDLEKEQTQQVPAAGEKKPIKKSDIGIFVFFGIMALLVIAAVVFVI